MEWTRSVLASAGFAGFVRFSELPVVQVPHGPGLYVIVRQDDRAPQFLPSNPAGRFKGKDPSVSRARLEAEWVVGARIVYIGKAASGVSGRRGLRKRLDEFRRFGAGEPIGHWGGRLIWQLGESESLLVCWKLTAGDPGSIETSMIADFAAVYGCRPFANLRN